MPFLTRLFFFSSLLLSLSTNLQGETIASDSLPKCEVRGAWLTTLFGLDWPKTKATSQETMEVQKAALVEQLEALKKAGVNLVFFQTRLRSDVAYRSKIEPMSPIFTGVSGADPGYDPLTFAIEECHKRGMECHAWVVAIPIGVKASQKTMGDQSLERRHPELIMYIGNRCYMNPGVPKTKEYLAALTTELVQNYDLDGIQYDYLRYPERAPVKMDYNTYKEYSQGLSLAEWRRNNLTEIMRCLYNTVKGLKPWVSVSTCPLGRYDNLPRQEAGAFTARNAAFQDAKRWLKEGLNDMLFPMMYYRANYFYPFVLDWEESSYGRPVIPGLGIYFLHPDEGKWTRDEVDRQINFIRKQGMAGEGHYRVKYVMDNTQGIYDELVDNFYAYPALQPPMPWLDKVAPSAPTELKVIPIESGYTELTWKPSTDNDAQNAPMYVIYASNEYPVDITRPENILTQSIRTTSYTYAPILPWTTLKHFAVTAIDRYGNESVALQEK